MAERKQSWLGYGVVVLLLHVVGILLLVTSRNHSALINLAFLAYTLGLRHAFDADHIAAIDNTVRKLIQQNKNPNGVGFYFSLGHSTVVTIMTFATIFAVQWAEKEIPYFQHIGGIIGTSVSGLFLLLIGIMNLFILINIAKSFFNMRRGMYNADKVEELLLSRGSIFRLIHPLLRYISKSWHVYPIGFLFGLGFDTASEVALLAISTGAAKSAIPISGVLALPILFAAGMSLLDTVDGIFMTNAYRWAFSTPLRKIYYNLTVTALAVMAALCIGLFELLQVAIPQLGLREGIWGWIANLDLGSVGYILFGLFVFCWGLSYCIWKVFRIEQRWEM
ncbi:HoxN/HupN/NixA family nickel/cobalt transporter [Fodinisporobacter ferrooxydans]|uniref:Nickel/cobalt efflux system n=2 Tax=Fodinisporobacter ferrooxydans TaxID=2901836 RepID=A0ABY4CTN2_9BACL|nr:HoxN/HupN/NixA family nickel/cobalt transporter [Alicyclobacillaceae bacterium MYW30-H2]